MHRRTRIEGYRSGPGPGTPVIMCSFDKAPVAAVATRDGARRDLLHLQAKLTVKHCRRTRRRGLRLDVVHSGRYSGALGRRFDGKTTTSRPPTAPVGSNRPNLTSRSGGRVVGGWISICCNVANQEHACRVLGVSLCGVPQLLISRRRAHSESGVCDVFHSAARAATRAARAFWFGIRSRAVTKRSRPRPSARTSSLLRPASTSG